MDLRRPRRGSRRGAVRFHGTNVGIVVALLLLVVFAGAAPFTARAGSPFPASIAGTQVADGLPGNLTQIPHDPDIWRLLRQGGRGHTTVPDQKAGVLIQASGQWWREFRETLLPRYGIWGLSGMCALLVLFYMFRGRIRIEAGFSGRTILRFGSLERFAHWLVAVSFMVLAVTGLNILYGRDVVKPLLGYSAFADVTAYGKWLHDFTGYSFIVGLVLILLLWIRDNLPTRHDLIWLARGGGLFSRGRHPPAWRFNAGQKMIFWFVILAGASMSFSGICLIFPFTFTPFSDSFAALNLLGFTLPTDLPPLQEMQLTHAWHAVLGLVMTVVIIAHIYLGSIGMEGAYDAMSRGEVDENWAREHHSLWVAELDAKRAPDRKNLSE
ncbi:MAG: formate dehydrogenase subunit gamma [Proteobacteria bacterium]|nr:formate dehydrogenase subunit gamma [Pseudomonadota bacterium]